MADDFDRTQRNQTRVPRTHFSPARQNFPSGQDDPFKKTDSQAPVDGSIEKTTGIHLPNNDDAPDSVTDSDEETSNVDPLKLPPSSYLSDKMQKLLNLLNMMSRRPFYFGLSFDGNPYHPLTRKDKIVNFIKVGFTQFDLVAEFISTTLEMLLNKLIIDPILFVGNKLNNFLNGDDGLVMLLPKIIASLVLMTVIALRAAVGIALFFTSFAINLTLRAVSTVLGLAVTPVNLMFNHVNESETPYQEIGLGLGAASCVTAAALWMLMSANMMNTTVLGTTAVAAWVISCATPLMIATSAAGVGLLIGVGIYKACTAETQEASLVIGQEIWTNRTDASSDRLEQDQFDESQVPSFDYNSEESGHSPR